MRNFPNSADLAPGNLVIVFVAGFPVLSVSGVTYFAQDNCHAEAVP